jgi:hypothetical protein
VTATEPGAKLTITVKKVVDDPKDCEEDEEEQGDPPSMPEPCPIELDCPPSEYYNWENWEFAEP